MKLTEADRAFLRGLFPGLAKLPEPKLQRWFDATHYAGNPAYDYDNESNDQ